MKKYLLIGFLLLFNVIIAKDLSTIKGIVRNESGELITGAVINIENKAKLSLQSDSAGAFEVNNIEPGLYKISVKYDDYDLRTETLQVEPGAIMSLVVTLRKDDGKFWDVFIRVLELIVSAAK